MTTVLIGASGYIGSAIYALLDKQNTVAVTRDAHPNVNGFAIDLAALPIPTNHPLFAIEPSEVIWFAKPYSGQVNHHKQFNENIHSLLLKWVESPVLTRIQFASSQQVYSGKGLISNENDKLDVAPYGLIEHYKLQSELFLRYISLAIRPDISIDIWRMPIMYGGYYIGSPKACQLFDYFFNQYLAGHSWKFRTDEERRAGFSWAYVPHFASMSLKAVYAAGYHIHNVASGFVQYIELHNLFSKLIPKIGEKPLKPYRLRFEILDDSDMPQLSIEKVFESGEVHIKDRTTKHLTKDDQIKWDCL